ncbi:alpha/beta hydrolase [Haloarchaeobius sp. DT45]|uniref:alpha/beta hydrolase n=1 Tax=Haloarchaeobius sp. DT45 TaxID=3446116 RepID=UPI003F6B9AF6
MDALDPTLAAVIDDMGDFLEWHELGVDEARRVEDEAFGSESAPAIETQDATVVSGSHEVPVRVYRPPGVDEPAPGFVFAHGGGFVLGTLASADDLARRLATETDSIVVSVDYRLAPEHPFPAGLADVTAAVEWVRENAATLGIDPAQLGVAGSSAGANLVVGAARQLSDGTTGVRSGDDLGSAGDLACQVLLYPMLDPRCDRDSHVEHADGPLLTRRDLVWFWSLYRDGDEAAAAAAAERVDDDTSITPEEPATADFAPLEADDRDLAALPPAVVVTAGVDPLRDDGTAYADALAAAGVPVAHQHHPGMCHGFLSLADSVPTAVDAWDALGSAVREYR